MKPSWYAKRPRQGSTLIEVVIYQSILLLLFSGLYVTVFGAMRYLRKSDVYQDVLRQAQVGLLKVSQELVNTSASSRTLGAGNQHILFLSPDVLLPASGPWTYTATGQLQYKKWVCFYFDAASGSLRRCERALGAPQTSPPAPAAPDFASQMLPLPAKTIARFVVNAQFLAGPSPTVTDVVLTTTRQTASDRDSRLALRTSIRMENP